MNPQEQLAAMMQFLQEQQQAAAPLEEKKSPTVPATMNYGRFDAVPTPAHADPQEQSPPTTEVSFDPEMTLVNMPEDLADCLRYCINNQDQRLVTVESVMLQQVLRELVELRTALNHITVAPKPTVTKLHFMEQENEPEAEKETPKKPVPKSRRRTKKTAGNAKKR